MFQKKQIFKISILKKLLTDDKSCVSLVSNTRLVALPPFFLNDMKSGILYILNAMLKKYDRSLGGIIIGYQNIKVLMDENTGIIPIGTSETEVNISVEFYIFQPKIGSYLEGVINKKSNTHIGCLVHRYFNATILKPEDVDYDDWICKDFSVDDKVIFKVKDLDFTTLLPYIEGVVEDKTSVTKDTKSCNADVLTTNHVNKSNDNDFLFSKNLFGGESSKQQNFKSGFTNSEKAKNEEEVNLLEDNLNASSGELKSVNRQKKKKKKKEREKNVLNLNDHNKAEQVKSTSDKVSFVSESEVSVDGKKKKKKKSKKNDNGGYQEILSAVETPAKDENPILRFLEQSLVVDDENDFLRNINSKVVKKKKRKDYSELSIGFNKGSEASGLPVEEVQDSVFYSTQLEPISEPKKMKMPFFSPISVETPKKKLNKIKTKNLNFSEHLNNANGPQEKEEKKKQKKRKREKEESKECPTPKKIKTSESSKEKAAQNDVNGVDVRSEPQVTLEEMYKKLLNEAKEQLNASDKEKSKSKKKKKESKKEKKREKKASQSEPSEVNKTSETRVNGTEENSVQSILNRLLEKEIKRVKQDLDKTDSGKSKSSKKHKGDKKEKKALKEKNKNESSKSKKLKSCDVHES